MEVFTEKVLLLEVLNTVCDKLNIQSSALVFLNRSYSDSDIQTLYSFFAEIEIKKEPIKVDRIVSKIQQINPKTSDQAALETIRELKAAFKDEKRFPWLIKQIDD
ncbi:hypothetical protein [Lentilactobacillus hilgardii]|uniref:hypothetical protein n=1 Tax=Lentilactobacillus hilgardii TaxID=1588 RepID=UPI003FA597FC